MHSHPSDQTNENKISIGNFTFCHDASSLKGLVMLADHQTIIGNILKDAVKPHYFWISEQTQEVDQIIQSLSEPVRNFIFLFSTIKKIQQFLGDQNKSIRKIILVSSLQRKKEIQILLRNEVFVGAITYDFSQNKSLEICQQENNSHQDPNSSSQKNPRIIHCSTETVLKIFLEDNEWIYAKEKTFFNFVLLKQEVEKSTELSRALTAMTQQKLKPKVRRQILQKLALLVSELCRFHQKLSDGQYSLQKVLNRLKKGSLNFKEIIRLYSSQNNKIYVLLNSFLRGLTCPTQLYYIQPIARDLFLAIQYCQRKAQASDFICYRGGFMSTEEFLQIQSAVGEIIQNLGFLSTSKNLQIAKRFYNNVLFKINFKCCSKSEKISGFADISQFSEFIVQEEILFNPFNYFKVMEVKQLQMSSSPSSSQFEIILEYGTLADERDLDDQNIRITQTLLKLNEEKREKAISQSRVILYSEQKQKFLNSQIFFQYFKNRAFQCSAKIKELLKPDEKDRATQKDGPMQLSSKEMEDISEYFEISLKMITIGFQREVKDRMQLINDCKYLSKIIYGENHQNCLHVDLILAKILLNQSRYNECLTICQKNRNIKKNGFNNLMDIYCENLNTLGHVLSLLNCFEDAKEVYAECLMLNIQNFGEFHPQTLNTMYWIGVMHSNNNEPNKALQIVLKSGNIQKRLQGQRNPEYLRTVSLTAYLFLKVGKYAQAIKINKICVNTQKAVLGEFHADYLISLMLMVDLMNITDKFQKALKVSKKMFNITKKALLKYHDEFKIKYQDLYLQASNHLIKSLINAGRLNEAYSLSKSTLTQFRKASIGIHPIRFANILYDNGACFMRLKNYQTALKIFLECHQIMKNNGGAEKMIFLIANHIGYTYMQLSRYQQALPYLSMCEGYYKTNSKKNSSQYLKFLANIGVTLMKLSKFNKAMEVHQKCYQLSTQVFSHSDPFLLTHIMRTSYNLKQLGRTEESLLLLKNTMKTQFNIEIVKRLIILSIEVGAFEEAEFIFSTLPMKQIVHKLQYPLYILTQTYKLTMYLKTFQKLISYVNLKVLAECGTQKVNDLAKVKVYEQIRQELIKKKERETKKKSKGRSWIQFSY